MTKSGHDIMVVKHHRGRIVRGDWSGGPYIDLSIGTEGYHPIEVINVWDYEKGATRGGFDYDKAPWGLRRHYVRSRIEEWIEENDKEWPEWHEDYQRNARY